MTNDGGLGSTRRGVGGTPGGFIEFFIGVGMVIFGGYLFANNLVVSSNLRTLWGAGNSGIALIILLVGIGFVFFRARSFVGWALIGVGALMIFYDVITNLVVYFRPTGFFGTIVMLGLVFGGLGMIARSLRSH